MFGFFSAYPWWWLALPVLLLPLWWHRQKRQRRTAEPLATARFLPAAAPEQIRVWRWRDRVLLLVRCLLLVALMAWLAATIFPWRGDTVLVDAGADQAWVDQQIGDAGMTAARRVPLPPDALHWLRQNERDWRAGARLLIVARSGQIAMPARPPGFQHAVELRVQAAPASAASAASAAAAGNVAVPSSAARTADGEAATVAQTASSAAAARNVAKFAGAEPVRHAVMLATSPERGGAWRALFAAFDRAGDGSQRYAVATIPGTDAPSLPDAGTALVVWDTPDMAPPVQWRARHWWIGAGTTLPALEQAATLKINGITLRYADSPRGRLWTSDAFPPRDATTARALYEAWRLLDAAPAPAYPAPSHKFGEAAAAAIDAQPASWIALVLLALFLLERILTHARPR